MKKILVTTAICLIGAASMMAQGRINFANTSATAIRINEGTAAAPGANLRILGTASTAIFGIGPLSTRVTLFAGLTADSLTPVLIGTSLPYGTFTSVTNSGNTALAAAQGTFPGGSNLGLQGYDGTAPVYLRMEARSINGIYVGISPVIQVNLATGAATATTLFSATPNANQWNGITMYAVPEPTSMALAGLGAASLLIFRRRK